MCKWKIITFLSILSILTVFCIVKIPAMHKPFQVNVIEYILKFNDDGSVTTTKSTTTTIMKEEAGE